MIAYGRFATFSMTANSDLDLVFVYEDSSVRISTKKNVYIELFRQLIKLLSVKTSEGFMYEVDTNGNTVWQYSDAPPKGFRRECAHPGIIALLDNPCEVEISSVGIIAANTVKVSPNPSYGTITVSGLDHISDFEISVTDMLGKVVLQSKNQVELSLRDLENGQYILSILTGETKVTKSLILAQ